MLLFMTPKKQLLTIRELMPLGQLHWLITYSDWLASDSNEPLDRELVMVKYALSMVDKVDSQAKRLLQGMVATTGKLYPNTDSASPLCLWDYWYQLIMGEEAMLPHQNRMPESMRELLKDQFNQAGLGIVNTKNSIRVN